MQTTENKKTQGLKPNISAELAARLQAAQDIRKSAIDSNALNISRRQSNAAVHLQGRSS
jgi:hypothetical protein